MVLGARRRAIVVLCILKRGVRRHRSHAIMLALINGAPQNRCSARECCFVQAAGLGKRPRQSTLGLKHTSAWDGRANEWVLRTGCEKGSTTTTRLDDGHTTGESALISQDTVEGRQQSGRSGKQSGTRVTDACN
ncbi:hypothetical protein P154DRAFT_228197 [Amniculicola lignicola CBS 123094]|uniref:Uncharacterized protein n=1 Tax=Amniculicola lignicola CBS 123094 TaxID=1392246 RepID=A0A6A5WDK3_9PLEO|nr:hypothetical protein P154DRAFT_228197 [Amniculicola lignicola CBS 123094]